MKLNLGILDKIKEDFIDKWVAAIGEGLQVAKEGVDSRTPEREGELLEATQIREPEEKNNRITGSVYNDAPHNFIVEKGVKGRVYKYRKPRGFIFYVGHGARMFTRTARDDKREILKAIRKRLLW